MAISQIKSPVIAEAGGLRLSIFEPPRPQPYYISSDGKTRLYLGDSFALLRQCKSEAFDLIFADPPYFLSNNGITCQSGKMVCVNKGNWDKSSSTQEMHEFNMGWLRECRRVLKPTGSIFISGTLHNIYSVGFALQTLGYKIINDIAWYKVNPPPNLSCRFLVHSTETILWAKRDIHARHRFNYEAMKSIGDPVPGKQMQSLWRISPPRKHEKRYGKHPTQKPEMLLDRIIRATTAEGDWVLDPFCGSGTTGVVATRLGRPFVGFELQPDYMDLSAKRIHDEFTY